MAEKRNALVDISRVAAAAGIILCHVDMTVYGAWGTLLGQFLSVRFSLMFFLAIIGFYLEKSYQAGKAMVLKRVRSLTRVYVAWSLVYLILSFVMLVLIEKVPLGQYLISRVTSFLFSGSYYHFWFYPAVIYALLFIGGAKKLLGDQALHFLMPLAVILYLVGLLGTGYLPIGQQIPLLHAAFASANAEAIMHLAFLGFPSIVFGMFATHQAQVPSGRNVLLVFVIYVAECVILCIILGWRENPQMLISTPLLTVVYLRWIQNSSLSAERVNTSLLRTVSAGMYNVHPLLLAAFAIVLPELNGIEAFVLCIAGSALVGWILYRLRKNQLFALFI